MKNIYKITFEDGNYFETGFNGDFEAAKKYYLGQKFELDETKPMVKCVGVIWLGFGK
jgi:hypothetical protein